MTREIKFKVWDKKNGMNDVFGWYLLSQSGMLWEHSPLEEPTMISYQSDCEILQSTGLTDKNGKEIFEGDLFYYTCDSDNLERLCKVIYCQDKMGFDVVQICEGREEILAAFVDGWECYETPKYLQTIEIIGNIYENPELLNQNG